MDLRTILRSLANHPIVVAFGVVGTVLAVTILLITIEPQYESRASIVLITPPQAQTSEGETVDVNPLETPNRVQVMATAMVEVIVSPSVVEQMRAAGLSADYAVTLSPSGTASILDLRTTSGDAASTADGMTVLLETVRSQLAEAQSRMGIAQSTWITSQPLTGPTPATEVSGSKIRVAVVALALGLGLTALLAVGAERLYGDRPPLRSLRARRRDRVAADQGPVPLGPSLDGGGARLSDDQRRRLRADPERDPGPAKAG